MAPAAPRVLVLAGHGRYADPWHDTAATSHRVAEILAGHGMDAEVRGTFPSAHERLAGVDLLVVNAGRGRVDPGFDGTDADWAPFHDAVRGHAAAGRGVLGLHQAANTFADSPQWAQLLGGRWVEGRSMHPPIGLATFDDPNALKPAMHMFVAEKVGWLEIDDGLPQHQQRPQ